MSYRSEKFEDISIEKLQQAKGYFEAQHMPVTDVAAAAISRMIPIKIKMEKYTIPECPVCGEDLGESVGDGYVNYFTGKDHCPNCLQRIAWPDGYDEEDD